MGESEDCKRLVESGIASRFEGFNRSKLTPVSDCGAVAKLFQESDGIELGSIHGNGRGYMEDCIVKGSSVLPFCEQALPVERAELGMTQPNGRQVRCRTAGPRGHVETDYSIFAAIALGSFHAQFVESLQIMLIDGRNGGAFFCCLDKCPERLQLFCLLIGHGLFSDAQLSLSQRLPVET
jgi:hypothetical protein